MRPPIDLDPLTSCPAFRRLWIGTSATSIGSGIGTYAVMLHVWNHTNDARVLGAVGLIRALPLIAFAIVGGTFGDSRSRRFVALVAACGQSGAALLLAGIALIEPEAIVAIVALVFVQSSFTAFGAPARRSLVAMLLPRSQVGAGIALTTLSFQIGMLVGPVGAGLIAAAWSTQVCFVAEACISAMAFYGLFRLPADVVRARLGTAAPWRETLRGLGYIGRRPVLAVAALSDANATVLSMPAAVFPVINAERFGGDPVTLGLFAPALAVGGLSASAVARTFASAHRPGLVMLVATAWWSAALLGFGLAGDLLLTLVFLALAGAADTVAVVARGTLVQLVVSDRYRGRVSGVDYMVGVAGPELGNVRAGIVADATSGSDSATIGAISGLAGAIMLTIIGRRTRQFCSTSCRQSSQ